MNQDNVKKATFSLTNEILQKLDDTWIQFRKTKETENRITKNIIVEKAIEMALVDLKNKGQLSEFYNRLLTEK